MWWQIRFGNVQFLQKIARMPATLACVIRTTANTRGMSASTAAAPRWLPRVRRCGAAGGQSVWICGAAGAMGVAPYAVCVCGARGPCRWRRCSVPFRSVPTLSRSVGAPERGGPFRFRHSELGCRRSSPHSALRYANSAHSCGSSPGCLL